MGFQVLYHVQRPLDVSFADTCHQLLSIVPDLPPNQFTASSSTEPLHLPHHPVHHSHHHFHHRTIPSINSITTTMPTLSTSEDLNPHLDAPHSQTTPETTPDQGTNLAQHGFILPDHAHILTNALYFDDWLHKALHTTQLLNLHRLLNINIPRPELNGSIHAVRWQNYSLQLKDWLARSMSSELYDQIASLRRRIVLADEFIAAARATFQRPDMASTTSFVNAVLYARCADFPSAARYLVATREAYRLYFQRKIDIKPYLALSRVWSELRSEIPGLVDMQIGAVESKGRNLWEEVSVKDFMDSCAVILSHVKFLEQVRLVMSDFVESQI